MVLTQGQKKAVENGNVDSDVPLAATKTRHWPRTIPYDWSSDIGRYLLLFDPSLNDGKLTSCDSNC